MTVVRRRTTEVAKPKPDHEVRCAVLNASQVSTSPIAKIVRLAEEERSMPSRERYLGLLMALEVLTCLPSRELDRQLGLPCS